MGRADPAVSTPGTLTDRQIAGAVVRAGFPPGSRAIAVAVALAESGGRPGATNHNSNGSTDYGLFQINSVHSDLLQRHTWSDPVDNARMAFAISSHGTNWSPWVAYTTGSYRQYLLRAQKAAREPVTPSGGAGTGTVPAGSLAPSVGGLAGLLASGDTWARVGFFLAGGFLILLALSRMAGVSATDAIPVGKIAKIAKGAK